MNAVWKSNRDHAPRRGVKCPAWGTPGSVLVKGPQKKVFRGGWLHLRQANNKNLLNDGSCYGTRITEAIANLDTPTRLIPPNSDAR